MSKNLLSALQNPVITSNKLHKEIDVHRLARPFVSPSFDTRQISPVSIVPKKGHGQIRLIHHLSFPEKNPSMTKFQIHFVQFIMLPLMMQLRLLSHLGKVAF